MALWVDKHRPPSFEKLDFHEDLGTRLQKLVRGGDFPHLLFYGPSGAGKKTRILALLREIYGPGAEKVKVEMRSFKINSRTVEMPIISSSYHIEMNPAQAGTADRIVIQQVLKEIAQSGLVTGGDATGGAGGSGSGAGGDGGGHSPPRVKIVVLSEVDGLSRGAQHSLRRTMEKYVKTCRLVLCCESRSRVLDPIQSRCLNIRVPAPKPDTIVTVLESVCAKERLVPNKELNERIAVECQGNLRRAILTLEASKCHRYPFEGNQEIQKADWEYFIAHMAQEIIGTQSPKMLMRVRGKLYELLSSCIPASVILETLVRELTKRCPDASCKAKTFKLAAQADHNLRCGTKEIFHLEAFVARFMSDYKRLMEDMFL